MTTLGRHPDALAVKLTIGDGAHLVATSENGWAGPVTLHYGPKFGDPAISDPGTVDGDEVSWTLTEDQVEARAEHGWARLEDNGVTLAAGRVLVWSGGLGSTATQTIASLTAGPPGPTAVSADADNVATLGTDGKIYVPPSSASAEGIQDVVGAMIVAAGGTYDDEAGTITLPSGGGGLGDVGAAIWDTDTFTYPTRPAAPMVIWRGPVDPRGLAESGFLHTVDLWAPSDAAVPDETPPTPGTLGASAITDTGFTLTVTGASDTGGLDPEPYRFSIDNGTTFSDWQTSNVFVVTGATIGTAYSCQHEVRDVAAFTALGDVITVTTTGVAPFTPTDLTGIHSWWDFSDTDSITVAAQVTVANQISGGPDLTGLATSGTRTLNGLNVIDFPNASDRLRTAASITLPQPFTAYVVAKFDATPESVALAVDTASPYVGYVSGSTWRTNAGTILNSGVTANTAAHVHGVIFNGAASSIRLDGAQIAAGAAGTRSGGIVVVGAASTGGAAPMTGFVGEVVLVSGALSGADATNLETYLKTKWGIA